MMLQGAPRVARPRQTDLTDSIFATRASRALMEITGGSRKDIKTRERGAAKERVVEEEEEEEGEMPPILHLQPE